MSDKIMSLCITSHTSVGPRSVPAPISTFHANRQVCYTNLRPFSKLHALKSRNLSSRYELKMSDINPKHGKKKKDSYICCVTS